MTRTKKHLLKDILVIAILAVIAGAEGWEDIENYGISKQQWLSEFLSRWNSGYYNTQKLFEEIVMAGYTGSYATVVRFTRYLKRSPGFEPRKSSTLDAFPRVRSSSH